MTRWISGGVFLLGVGLGAVGSGVVAGCAGGECELPSFETIPERSFVITDGGVLGLTGTITIESDQVIVDAVSAEGELIRTVYGRDDGYGC